MPRDAQAQLSAIAVTVGPGLSLCLDAGVRKALALCARCALARVLQDDVQAANLLPLIL